MSTLIVSQAEVRELLPMNECMDLMARALQSLARAEALLPLRSWMWLPDRQGMLVTMPSYLDNPAALGVKVITVFPGNHSTPYDTHQGAVLLFDPEHGQLRAIMDATEITAIRTAAVSGVATQALAREDAGDLAILGSGTQARTHLAAMRYARPLRRVRVWSRNPDHAHAFAERESVRYGIAVEPMPSAQAAVDGADIVCTVTSARDPVLMGAWIGPGTHINAVGASAAFARELDTAAVVKSRLFVDRRESALNEAGDFLLPKQEGAISDAHIQGELGEVLLGRVDGRRSADEVTLFKSLGLAVEDVASAWHIYHKAVQRGGGTRLELGGHRHEA